MTDQPTGPQGQRELAPCPFCGEPPETEPSGENRRGLMIECVTDGCVNPHVSYYDHATSVAVWNRRAADGITGPPSPRTDRRAPTQEEPEPMVVTDECKVTLRCGDCGTPFPEGEYGYCKVCFPVRPDALTDLAYWNAVTEYARKHGYVLVPAGNVTTSTGTQEAPVVPDGMVLVSREEWIRAKAARIVMDEIREKGLYFAAGFDTEGGET